MTLSPSTSVRSPAEDAVDDRPGTPDLAPGSDRYRWSLDPLQRFDTLLEIAARLATYRPEATDRLTGAPVLNLYLVVCALDQVLSDHLHRHFYDLDRAGFPRPVRRTLDRVSAAQRSLRRLASGTLARQLERADRRMLGLARLLAGQVLAGEATASPAVVEEVRWMVAQHYPAGLRRKLLKLPQSFRGVDLYPEDCALLAQRAHDSAGSDRTPVAVIGLRTSGHYMAPLCAAALGRLGRQAVELFSLRPGSPTLPNEERGMGAVAARGGWAFVVDDPTWRGGAFAKAVATLERIGFSPDRICLAACEIGNQPVFKLAATGAGPSSGQDEAGVWPGFSRAPKVVLGKDEWRIHSHLSDAAAERILNLPEALRRLGADRVRVRRGHPFSETGEPPAIAGLDVARRQRRFHAQKIFEIEVFRPDGMATELVVGRGVGLGFFGYHSWLIGQGLDGAIPDLLGLANGVLFTRWRTGRRLEGTLREAEVDAVARYVARRAEALGLEDPGRPVAETRAVYTGARQVARLLGRTMGGVGALAQYRMADSIAREIAPRRRSAVDARMGPLEWVRTESSGLVKVDFEEHGFDITDRWVTDAVHDLAAAGVGLRLDREAEARLVATYTRLSGDSANLPARLTLHRLLVGSADLEQLAVECGELQLGGGRDRYALDLVATEGALTRTINDYLAGIYLVGVTGRDNGAIWAIDLDDTLENDWVGSQATSPAGAKALRSLLAHDQLVIASTGRSLEEVRDRCAVYGVAGGIAEYGAVAWDARNARTVVILEDGAKRQLERLREAISAETDIMSDPRYQHTLRLFRPTPDGRRGMKVEEIEEIIERHRLGGLEVVEGFRKTVVWANGTNKASALSPLLESLGVDRDRRSLHVIGDEFTDLGLMKLADRRHAPANATAALRSHAGELAIEVATRGRAAGVLEIVQRQLHGRNRECPACASPRVGSADAVLVELLGVQDRSRLGRLAYALHPTSLRAFEH